MTAMNLKNLLTYTETKLFSKPDGSFHLYTSDGELLRCEDVSGAIHSMLCMVAEMFEDELLRDRELIEATINTLEDALYSEVLDGHPSRWISLAVGFIALNEEDYSLEMAHKAFEALNNF